MTFVKAVRHNKPLKMVLDGPSGSGKTYTALRLAFQFGKKVFVIDTEHGRASLYAGEVVDEQTWEFQVNELTCYSVGNYVQAIQEAVGAGADVLVIDSISHAWDAPNGILDAVEIEGKKRDENGRTVNSFQAWQRGSKLYKELVDAILAAPIHTICTMRTKTNYEVQTDENGKVRIQKKGTTPIQRDGIEYEFDLVMRMENGIGIVTKSPGPLIESGHSETFPGKDFANTILNWLHKQVPASAPKASEQPEEQRETVPEETPGIGEEFSPDEAFAQVAKLQKGGKITLTDILTWGRAFGLPENIKEWKAIMSDDLKVKMASDLTCFAATGQFESLPF